MLMKLRAVMQRKEGQKGFTLIELIVVMAILAILAALAVPKFSAILQNSKRNASDNNIDLIAKAAEMYYGATNNVPGSIDSLTISSYLKDVPANPVSSGITYSLVSSGTGIKITPGKFNGSDSSSSSYEYKF